MIIKTIHFIPGEAAGYDGLDTKADFLSPVFMEPTHPVLAATSAPNAGIGQPKALYLCEYCDTSFTFESSLNRHRNSVHLNRNLHVCGICGKCITRKENFEDHMNMHNNIRPHKCPQCGIGFSFKNKLRHHVRTQH